MYQRDFIGQKQKKKKTSEDFHHLLESYVLLNLYDKFSPLISSTDIIVSKKKKKKEISSTDIR